MPAHLISYNGRVYASHGFSMEPWAHEMWSELSMIAGMPTYDEVIDLKPKVAANVLAKFRLLGYKFINRKPQSGQEKLINIVSQASDCCGIAISKDNDGWHLNFYEDDVN